MQQAAIGEEARAESLRDQRDPAMVKENTALR